jgi:hypothetical protein
MSDGEWEVAEGADEVKEFILNLLSLARQEGRRQGIREGYGIGYDDCEKLLPRSYTLDKLLSPQAPKQEEGK